MLVTKAQLQMFFSGWGCTEPVPPKGKKVLVAFPGRGDLDVDLAEAYWTDRKSDSGDRLYGIVQSSRAGREFERTVQEAHVVEWVEQRYWSTLHIAKATTEEQGNLPAWPGAKSVYTAVYAMLRRMATELGHVVIQRDSKGRPIGSSASQDMRDIIAALNHGGEEELKGYLQMGRAYGWVAS
jgi:hypothetical protein